jgi:hypothetical protein
MRRRSIKLLSIGLSLFVLGLTICVLLKPVGLRVNSGISYYGNYRLTIFPYVIAIVGYGFFNLLLASCIKARGLWPLKYSFYIFGLLSLIIVITPYSVSAFLSDIHTTVGTILFVLQLLLSGWIVVKMNYKFWPVVFLGIMLLSGIFSAFYVPVPHGFLIQAQIIFQLSFAGLLYCTLNNLIAEHT